MDIKLKSSIILLFLCLIKCTLSGSVFFQVNEDEPVGYFIGEIDPNPNSRYIFPDTKYFKVDENFPNRILIKSPLDRDRDPDLCNQSYQPNNCTWSGIVLVDDSNYVNLEIVINDVNDNTPTWQSQSSPLAGPAIIRVPISENAQVGQTFDLPMASDPDSGPNSIVSYSLVKDFEYDGKFSLIAIETPNGLVPRLILNKVLDYEEQQEYNLTIAATDGPGKIGTAQLIISVIDENDNAPEFENPNEEPFLIRIDEDLKINSKLPRHPIAKDRDSGRLGTIRYKFALSTKDSVRRDFSIDQVTGDIIVRNNLDYDNGPNKEYSMTIIAEDGGNPALSSEAHVTVILQDVNDNKPAISLVPVTKTKRLEIDEGIEPEKLLATVTVSDADSGKSGEFSCALDSGENFLLKKIHDIRKVTLYQLWARKRFDRESESIIRDTIVCPDMGDKPEVAKKYLQLDILDINDNPPQFNTKNFSFQFAEGNKPNEFVGQVRALDRDIAPNNIIEYELIWPQDAGNSQVFRIDNEGRIYANQEIDRETNPKGFYFQVIARDPVRRDFEDSAYVEIALKDINDCIPEFIQKTYHYSVEETDATIDTNSRTFRRDVGTVKATDCDTGSNSHVTYSILNQNVPFDIDQDGTIFLTSPVDREETPAFLLTIEAKDEPKLANGQTDEKAQLSSQVKVNIVITDVNDNPPKFVFPQEISRENPPSDLNVDSNNIISLSYQEAIGFHVTRVECTDPDSGDNGRIFYSIYRQTPIQNMFQIDENNGDLVLSRKLTISDLGPFKLFLEARDNGSPVKKSFGELIVNVTNQEPVGNGSPVQGQARYRGNNNFLAFFTRDKIIIVGIISATIVISTALIMIICLVFRGCPKSKSSWAETRRSLVLGRGFSPEEMISGYHGNTLSSFDFPSDSENNLHPGSDPTTNNKDTNLIFSNGINHLPTHQQKSLMRTNNNSPSYYHYKPMVVAPTGGYNTLRSFSPSIISTNQYPHNNTNSVNKSQRHVINSPSMSRHNLANTSVNDLHNQSSAIVYPIYNHQGSNGNCHTDGTSDLLFANLENLTSTFISNSNESTATTTNEAKSTSSETMTRISADRHFELNP